MHKRFRLISVVGATLTLLLIGGMAAARTEPTLVIKTLSSRPDMVSGGDTLLEIQTEPGAKLSDVVVQLNGVNVSDQMSSVHGRLRGLIGGMKLGKNQLTATLARAKAELTIVNHPITGPILSGPHLAPC